jgi:hypothetical protein
VARELLDSGEPVLIAKDGDCIGVSKIPFSVASQILSEISSCLDYSGLRLQAVQESLSFNSPIKASASSHLATSLQSSSGGRYQSTKSSTRNMPYNGENSGSD